jgi:hypothetical protein
MNARLFTRLTRVAAAVALLVVLGASVADARPGPRPGRTRGFNLFAGTFDLFQVNRIACGVANSGEVCTDPGNSPIGGGGFWPKGTPDQYIFNTGIQVAGIIPADAGFDWAGDTVGVFFIDAAGGQEGGSGLENVWNSLNPADAANWPSGGFVHDTSVYNQIVIDQAKEGVAAVGQQDLWTRTWDGDPSKGSGRKHPMGILMEYRGMAWNYPSGNEDIIYFVFDFYNVTASAEAPYRNGNIDPEIQDEVWHIGQQFQQNMEDYYSVSLPDAGYRMDQMYSSFTADMDVGDFENNYATAVLPFSIGAAYKNDFLEPGWTYPPDIFGAPFAAAPGFVGVKYLRSPADPNTGEQYGLTLFSNTLNSATGFPDPEGVVQLWRYLSGRINTSAGDFPCTFPNPVQKRLCFLAQDSEDSRFFQSSGPFSLEPGYHQTIVVAYIQAAPVAAAIESYVGGDLKPGFPASGAELAANPSLVRDIEKAMGWVSATDVDADGEIEQAEVEVVPRSLLAKALIAQSVFDERFLLPSAPLPPTFYLVPGPDQVTIVWEPSPSETTGDPYYNVASLPLTDDGEANALFDPNFRQYDVEGYRIYRGRTSSDLELIAQFDYVGDKSIFTDYTGAIHYGQCAPELGIFDQCPETFAYPITNTGPTYDTPIAGNVVQVKPGDRVELADGSVFVVKADTAVVGGGSSFPALTDGGVPFAFTDKGVRNSLRYTYAVTAFDVNSVSSGPTSLESAGIPQSVTPRGTAGNEVAADVRGGLFGAPEEALDVLQPNPSIDGVTGTLSGPAAPASIAFNVKPAEVFVPAALVDDYTAQVRIDSIVPEYYAVEYFFTVTQGSDVQQVSTGVLDMAVGDEQVAEPIVLASYQINLPADSNVAKAAGLGPLTIGGAGAIEITLWPAAWHSLVSDFAHDVAGSFWGQPDAFALEGGSRWFEGDNETMADPTLAEGHGQLTGVTKIHQPSPYVDASTELFRRYYQVTWAVTRAADIKVYWGAAAGTVDSVIDVTHKLPVPFDPQNRASWGFRNDITGSAAGSAADGVLTDLDYLYGACLPGAAGIDNTGCDDRDYAQTPVIQSVDVDGDLAADGNGFGMYINGHPFIFQADALPSGTVWTLRSYAGEVYKEGGQYKLRTASTNAGQPIAGNAAVPGLVGGYYVASRAAYPDTVSADALARVHTVPDPYYATSAMEVTASAKSLKFVNLPTKAIIRIYSVSGVLLRVIEHDDPTGGGEATWDLRNRNNQYVASGVYFFHVETPDGKEKIGRFTVINYSP